jgi:hypothetical protein
MVEDDMATHNRNYGNMVPGRKVVEQSKWGNAKAYERYGSPQHFHGAPQPRDMSQPQDPVDKPDPKWNFGDAKQDWRGGFGKGGVESAEDYPNFDNLRMGRAKK